TLDGRAASRTRFDSIMVVRRRSSSGFAAFGDLLVKMVVFAIVMLAATAVLAYLGLDFRIACGIGVVAGVFGAAKSGVN
ncbi:MAG: hypothetical protein K8T90_18025, partial [Planctomycetes bacterium]|nr:hypothetical protein [Planctomycetota bacterium]